MKKSILYALTAFLPLFFIGCNKEKIDENESGQVNFSVTTPSSSLKSALVNDAKFVLVSIVDANGKTIYAKEKIELIRFNSDFISKPLSLIPGNYKLTEFIVLDGVGNTIYASPIAGSPKAYLVKIPLSIIFNVNKDNVTKVVPEVVSTDNIKAEDFGYSTFSFNIVKTFNFLISTFSYNATSKNFELTSSNLTITCDSSKIFSLPLTAITNQVSVVDGYVKYTLKVEKKGYKSYIQTFTNSELKKYFSSTDNGPLKVILEPETTSVIVIQPDSTGKDAVVCYIIPNENRGQTTHSNAYAWTQQGSLNITRALLDFGFTSKVSKGTTIKKATLYMYYAPYVPGMVHAGDSRFYVRNITTAWGEFTVTWNNQPSTTTTNQVLVPQFTSPTQDYAIDVTALVQDGVNAPERCYGMMLQLVNEQPYNNASFASSDYPDATKHPKLVIEL